MYIKRVFFLSSVNIFSEHEENSWSVCVIRWSQCTMKQRLVKREPRRAGGAGDCTSGFLVITLRNELHLCCGARTSSVLGSGTAPCLGFVYFGLGFILTQVLGIKQVFVFA